MLTPELDFVHVCLNILRIASALGFSKGNFLCFDCPKAPVPQKSCRPSKGSCILARNFVSFSLPKKFALLTADSFYEEYSFQTNFYW